MHVSMMYVSIMRLKFCYQRTNEQTNKAILGVGSPGQVLVFVIYTSNCRSYFNSPALLSIDLIDTIVTCCKVNLLYLCHKYLFKAVIHCRNWLNRGGTFQCFVTHMRTLQSPTYADIGRMLKVIFLEIVFLE